MAMLKEANQHFLPKFMTALPLDDEMFRSQLLAGGLFPGNTTTVIAAQQNKAVMVLRFSNLVIEWGFYNSNNTNEPLSKLPKIM